jgi:hypothetical protein
MIPTHVIPYRDGELRIGWASWDDGTFQDRSIKYAYPDKSGKISRGCPELPFDILIDMLMLAYSQGELANLQSSAKDPTDIGQMTPVELDEERKKLTIGLMTLQKLMMDFPWVSWKNVYDALGARQDQVKAEQDRRR